jgi:hypothetical protein
MGLQSRMGDLKILRVFEYLSPEGRFSENASGYVVLVVVERLVLTL